MEGGGQIFLISLKPFFSTKGGLFRYIVQVITSGQRSFNFLALLGHSKPRNAYKQNIESLLGQQRFLLSTDLMFVLFLFLKIIPPFGKYSLFQC